MGIVFAELWVEAATFKFGSTRVTDGKERFATARSLGIGGFGLDPQLPKISAF